MTPLDPERWQQIRTVLHEALEQSPDRRAAFLDRRCAGDAELRGEVESLLQADEESGDFLDTPAAEFAAELIGAAESEPAFDPGSLVGSRVSHYQLVRELGRGGAGAVYLARRADGHFDQEVALKLIRADRDSQDIARRFVQERQILAGLDHPNIARLLDGGVTDDGRPFFAMEFVDGLPITEYADKRQLTVRARAELFEDVCDAVRYAQERLVVHRDLKPSNIFVTAAGQVKLLDFGIARVVGEREEPGFTQDGARLMTPEYAAPEQIRGTAVTTATDVYALGGVLYELLAGRRPHAGGAFEAIERTLADREPESLADVLDQDLANIVAKAMRTDPVQRYATAAALLADLRRFRQGLPIEARAPSFTYRARKFIQRRRLAVGAAAAMVVLAATGVAGVIWQSRVAQREAAVATEVKDFLVSVFTERDPDRSGGADPTASEILERGTERVDRELSDQPIVRAEMLQVIGSIHHRLGDLERAEPLLERSLAIREETLGPDHPDSRSSLATLAQLEYERSNLARAESLFVRALESSRAQNADDLASLALDFAAVLHEQGRLDEAEPYYREALALDRARYGSRHPEVAKDLSNLGVFLMGVGRPEDAEHAAREALGIRRETLPEDHPDIHLSLHNLGWILMTRGELDEAEILIRDVIARRRALYDKPHPHLIRSLQTLGTILRTKDDLVGATEAIEESLSLARSVYGSDAEPVALALNDLGIVAYHRGELEVARGRFEESLRAFRAFLDEEHPTVLTLRSNIATLSERVGDYETAERVYRELLATRVRSLGEEHPDTALGYRSWGSVLTPLGRFSEAVPNLQKALAIQVAVYGEDHEEVSITRVFLASAFRQQGDLKEAERQARAALHQYESAFEGEHRRIHEARLALGQVLDADGRSREAEPLFASVLASRRENFAPDSEPMALAMCLLGGCRLRIGELASAETLLSEGYRILQATRPASHPTVRAAAADLEQVRKTLARTGSTR